MDILPHLTKCVDELNEGVLVQYLLDLPFHAGKGLTLITSVLEGEYNEMKAEAIAAKQVP